MEGAIFIVAILAVVGLSLYGRYYFTKKRREALARVAASLGLEYSPEDSYGFDGLPFKLFDMGDGRGTENVLSGTWQDIALSEFDYWYYDQSTDSKGHTSRTYHKFSCVLTELPIDAQPITIGRESVFTRLADHLGMQDIQFESESFNRAFNVKCDDKKFATDLVDARMMTWLESADEWSFELAGQYLLCYSDRLKPTELIPLLGTLKAFRDHVPRVVHELYGRGKVESPEGRSTP